MSQIEIQILKQGTETKKVISGSFFTMKDAYRIKEKYVTHLKKFCSLSNKPGFCCRIYTDESGRKEALEIAELHSHVSVYHFNCPEFREELGHNGTFGTLVRFLPLFEKGLDIVWVSDIDIPLWWLDEIPKKDFNYKTNVCFNTKLYGHNYNISASFMLSRITFPKQLLTKFINNLANGKLDDTVKRLHELYPRKPNSRVPYTIDEVFTNTAIYNYLVRHDVEVSVEYDYLSGIDGFLVHSGKLTDREIDDLRVFYIKHDKSIFDNIKILLKKHLPWAATERPCIKETLDLLSTFKTSFVKTYVLKGSELK